MQSLTCNLQDSSKPLEAPGEGSRSQVVEVDGIKVTLYIAKESLTAELQGECLQGNLEEQSKEKLLGAEASAEFEATEALGDSPVSQPKYFHSSSSPHTDIPPQNPSIKPQHAKDKLRADEQLTEAEACAPEVLKFIVKSQPTPMIPDAHRGCGKYMEVG
ncbi:hypothetical protein EDD16DRAFT_1701221 [Pisolithus croceorrhizus]|nr:hypothetical protein EDD16DRAFT_1701221 [Pisolithus croceorrhizus]KAI6129953.1 hypothetical protein EV401DRAFT_2066471 [Pisolithus croceorrhizus]